MGAWEEFEKAKEGLLRHRAALLLQSIEIETEIQKINAAIGEQPNAPVSPTTFEVDAFTTGLIKNIKENPQVVEAAKFPGGRPIAEPTQESLYEVQRLRHISHLHPVANELSRTSQTKAALASNKITAEQARDILNELELQFRPVEEQPASMAIDDPLRPYHAPFRTMSDILLAWAKEHPGHTIEEIVDELGEPHKHVVSNLVRKGFLRTEGKKPNFRYFVDDSAREVTT